MTKEENIATLNEHLEHWKRLLSEKICNQTEGEKTIDALQNAIKALEQEPFINKPCVSEKVCEHDKQMVLDKIRAEIMSKDGLEEALEIIDRYKAEGSEE